MNHRTTVDVRAGTPVNAAVKMISVTEVSSWAELKTAAEGAVPPGVPADREEIIIWRGGDQSALIDLATDSITIQRPITIIAENGATITKNVTYVVSSPGYTTPLFTVDGPYAHLALMEGLTLDGNKADTDILANNAAPLVLVQNGGTLVLDGATLTNNRNSSSGGGVYIDDGTFTMSGGSIINNTSGNGGGVYNDRGLFTMTGGIIGDNQALNGGGVFINNSGTLTATSTFNMSGGAVIRGNTATTYGGGVSIENTNTASGTSTFNMTGGTIGGLTSADANTAPLGGGVSLKAVSSTKPSTFNLSGGSVLGNKALTGTGSGGGVGSDRGTIIMDGGTIANNQAILGGGVYIDNAGSDTTTSTFAMSGSAVIRGNTATTQGGGVFVRTSSSYTTTSTTSTFTMTGGTIGGPTSADANTAPMGGGVYLTVNSTSTSSLFALSGGSIIGNRATVSGSGGGVCATHTTGTSTFTMTGTAIIGGNEAVSYGGGVFVDNSTFDKNSGGTIYGSDASTANRNRATLDGPAVYELTGPHHRNNTLNVGDSISTATLTSPPWDD
jgi:hypothetical protein